MDTAKKSSSVVIVNPSRLFREGLKQLLRKSRIAVERDGCSVAEILGGRETQHPADLVICSLNLDERAAAELQAVPELRAAFPGAKVIILTDVVSAGGVRAAVRAGVEGILSAEVSHDVLQRSLELVMLGQTLFPARLLHPQDEAAAAAEIAPAPAPAPAAPVAPREMNRRIGDRITAERIGGERLGGPQLSEREGQILQCLVLGSSNKAIARKFNISEATVKVHIRALLRKIRVSNRTQAAIWALNNRPHSERIQNERATDRNSERLNGERLNGRAAAAILEPSHA